MKQQQIKTTNELVLNWHITEACNYSCRYCFARWNKADKNQDIIHNENSVKKLLLELNDFFRPSNPANPLQKFMSWSSLRLNLVGGEPLLYEKKLLRIINLAKDTGMSTSLVTNGSRLSNSLMKKLAPNLSLLGISLDSIGNEVNRRIGRQTRKGGFLDPFELCKVLSEGRLANPSMKIKVNTVVNSENCDDNLTEIIQPLRPDRWKVLKVLPVQNNNLVLSDTDFDRFVRRHSKLLGVMCIESNADMTESYIMIDPKGRFFQNSAAPEKKGYDYSSSILDVGVEGAFSCMSFSPEKFISRYALNDSEAIV